MRYKEINREAIRLSRTIETHKAEKLFRYNAAHYPSSMTINNLAWFLYLEYPDYDTNALIQMFKMAYSLCPNMKSLMATAQLYFDSNRFYRAEIIMKRALESHYSAPALSLLLVTKLNLHKYSEAKELCKTIIHREKLFKTEPDFIIDVIQALCDCEIECGESDRALIRLSNLIKTIGYKELGYTPFCLMYKAGRYDIVAKTLKKYPKLPLYCSPRADELFIIINSCSKTFDNVDIVDFESFIDSKYQKHLLDYIYPLAKPKNNHMNYHFSISPIKCSNYICDYM